jgi:hypothetical protein
MIVHVDLFSEKAVRTFEGVAARLIDMKPGFESIANRLEEGERQLFDSLGGRYVDTGRTRDSLTQPSGNDAIRSAHHDELIFGTAVPYARFLRKPDVLPLTDREANEAGVTAMAWIMGAHGARR